MLSFMKENDPENLTGSKKQGKEPLNLNLSDGDKEHNEPEYLTVSNRNESVRKTTILLAALFVIGVISLVLMIKKSTPDGAEAGTSEDKTIETAISRLTGIRSEMFNKMDEILNKFTEFSNIEQVKVNELTKNPFKTQDVVGQNDRISNDKNIDNMALMKKQHEKQEIENMSLLSIMQSGSGSCAMIGDKLLYKGDKIKSFEVAEIGEDFVRLRWSGDDKGTAENVDSHVNSEIILTLTE